MTQPINAAKKSLQKPLPDAAVQNPQEASQASQASNVFQQLRALILSFALSPYEVLVERQLELRFGVSRTPVRAALLRLEGEGLITREGRSYIVSPLNIAEIEQAFELRVLLECATIRKACALRNEADIQTLKALIMSADLEQEENKLEYGLAFHLEIARIAGNELIVKILRDVNTKIFRATWLQATSTSATQYAHEEHLEIIACIEAGNAEAAEQAIEAHIQRTKDDLLKLLAAFHALSYQEKSRQQVLRFIRKAA